MNIQDYGTPTNRKERVLKADTLITFSNPSAAQKLLWANGKSIDTQITTVLSNF